MAEFNGVRISRLVLIGVVGLVVVGGFFLLRKGAKARDVCDLDFPELSVTVCLVQEGDPRASGLEIGTDCYWQTKTIDKSLRGWHGGGRSSFRFEVLNRCAQAVTVELEFQPTRSISTSAKARMRAGGCRWETLRHGEPEGRRCTTIGYRYEILASRRSPYALHAVKVNGNPIAT